MALGGQLEKLDIVLLYFLVLSSTNLWKQKSANDFPSPFKPFQALDKSQAQESKKKYLPQYQAFQAPSAPSLPLKRRKSEKNQAGHLFPLPSSLSALGFWRNGLKKKEGKSQAPGSKLSCA